MEDVPAMPIVANKHASLTSSSITKIKDTYTNNLVLTKASANGYKGYLEKVEAFLAAHYEEYKSDSLSYFYKNYYAMSYEEFKEESSHYGFLFEKKKK